MVKAISPTRDGVFNFGSFELTPKRRLLSRHGRPVKLGSRAIDLLIVLVENAGNVIAKSDLISQVWGSVVVEDTNLRVHISVLRRVLGDDGCESRFIVHVARRGYIFVAPLVCCDGDRIAPPITGRPVRGTLRTSTVSSDARC